MKKALTLLVFCVLFFSSLPAKGFTEGCDVPVYMMRGNIFSQAFTEPVEVVIFIADNGNFYRFTNYMSDSVSLVMEEFEYILEKDGLTIENLIIVIHNHLIPPFKFSQKDKKFYSFLVSKGFKGLFLLWSSFHRKVMDCLPIIELGGKTWVSSY